MPVAKKKVRRKKMGEGRRGHGGMNTLHGQSASRPKVTDIGYRYERKPMPKGWDGATDYAKAVVEGRQEAPQQVIDECSRHLADIESGKWDWEPRLGWDAVEDMKACSGELVWDKDGEIVEGECGWVVDDWMYFLVCRLLGFIRREPDERAGYRRFYQCVLITPRGSGKTKLAIYLLGWCVRNDNWHNRNCYVAARDTKQSRYAWDELENSYLTGAWEKDLDDPEFTLYGGNAPGSPKKLHRFAGGFIEQISGRNPKSLIGANPHWVLLDEYEQHIDKKLYTNILQGAKADKHPMLLVVSNAGETLKSPCGQLYSGVKAVSKGKVSNDELFGLLYEVDKEDDPLTDDEEHFEYCCKKAHPSFPHHPDRSNLRYQTNLAKTDPSQKNEQLRMMWGRWVSSESSWIPLEKWKNTMVDELPEERHGWRCYLGVDLSERDDLTAGLLCGFRRIRGCLRRYFVGYRRG